MLKFVAQPSACRRHDRANAHFKTCQDEQVPYVVVETKRKYATVRWDYIAYGKWADQIIKAAGQRFVDELAAVFRRHAWAGARPMVSAHLAELKRVPIEQAEELAAAVFDCVQAAVATGRKAD